MPRRLTTKLKYLRKQDSFFSLQRNKARALQELLEASHLGAQELYSSHHFSGNLVEKYNFLKKHQYIEPRAEAKYELLKTFYAQRFLNLKNFPLIGLTGTNGKTSCAHLLSQALAYCDQRWATLGTLGLNFPQGPNSTQKIYSDGQYTWNLTTPDLIDHFWVKDFLREEKFHGLICEVSSHALIQKRVYGVSFKVVISTEVSVDDHLDYHKTPLAYLQAKAKLFHEYKSDFKVLKHDNLLVPHLKDYSKIYFASDHDFQEKKTKVDRQQSQTDEEEFQEKNHRFLSYFHQSHKTLIFKTLSLLRLSPWTLKFDKLIHPSLKGRGQMFQWSKNRVVLVDYAHTPEALGFVGRCLQKSFPGKKITVVFGCGGDRDKGKRPLMYHQVCQFASSVIVTEDNNRSEPFSMIAQGILSQSEPEQRAMTRLIQNRAKAIELLYQQLEEQQIALVAGKGPELYTNDRENDVYNTDLKQVESYV